MLINVCDGGMITKGIPRRGSEGSERGKGVGGGVPPPTVGIFHIKKSI